MLPTKASFRIANVVPLSKGTPLGRKNRFNIDFHCQCEDGSSIIVTDYIPRENPAIVHKIARVAGITIDSHFSNISDLINRTGECALKEVQKGSRTYYDVLLGEDIELSILAKEPFWKKKKRIAKAKILEFKDNYGKDYKYMLRFHVETPLGQEELKIRMIYALDWALKRYCRVLNVNCPQELVGKECFILVEASKYGQFPSIKGIWPKSDLMGLVEYKRSWHEVYGTQKIIVDDAHIKNAIKRYVEEKANVMSKEETKHYLDFTPENGAKCLANEVLYYCYENYAVYGNELDEPIKSTVERNAQILFREIFLERKNKWCRLKCFLNKNDVWNKLAEKGMSPIKQRVHIIKKHWLEEGIDGTYRDKYIELIAEKEFKNN